MSKEISVNSGELIQATAGAQIFVNAINTNMDQWVNQGENSISLQAFAEQFYELEKVMELYQKLLRQDINSIRDIGIEFFLSDFKLAKLWGPK